MWPFGNPNKKVSSSEFASILLELMRRCVHDSCGVFQKHAEENWGLEPEEVTTLRKQVLIAYLWMVSKALGPDNRVLNILDGSYLSATGESENVATAELWPRYEKYYKAWDADRESGGGLALAFEMSQYFFPKHKPVLDSFLQASIQAHVGAFITSILELRKKYIIVDS